jgi:hypothetical protein
MMRPSDIETGDNHLYYLLADQAHSLTLILKDEARSACRGRLTALIAWHSLSSRFRLISSTTITWLLPMQAQGQECKIALAQVIHEPLFRRASALLRLPST